jgi:hypothetical protein
MSSDPREAAWSAVHEALPARWRVGPPSFDPGRPGWSVTAIGPLPGRGKMPTTVSATGNEIQMPASVVLINTRPRNRVRKAFPLRSVDVLCLDASGQAISARLASTH